MLQKDRKDGIVIGAALFAMFFGAGNMIFPPFLGFESGTEWFLGFLCYFLADIGLAILTVFALLKAEAPEKLFSVLGNLLPKIILLCVVLCIGPVICIPRTGATTFELSVTPLFPGCNPIPFYIGFFALTFFMCVKKSAVVDLVGKILTPVLFIGLLALIILGIINASDIAQPKTLSVSQAGIQAGYQSMDVLAAIIFGVLIIQSAKDKGHTSTKQTRNAVVTAGLVAGVGLLIVYLGLTYLGAVFSSSPDFTMHTGRTELLTSIIRELFPGNTGLWFFAIVAGFACLSTSIALTGSCAEYISNLTRGKLKYSHLAFAICLFSAIAACVGVEGLVAFASPILSVLYPPILILILLHFIKEYLPAFILRLCAGIGLAVGILQVLQSFGIRYTFFEHFPLAQLDLQWLVPVSICLIIGFIIKKITK
ncbi:MAG: branched-chain amino acid transport system II carrier protein [Clostridia bacterium]|nr:branched-chain amino acid transport system II carrier protein [Clostridia bacterium]